MRRVIWLVVLVLAGAAAVATAAGRWASVRAWLSRPAAASGPVAVMVLDGSFSPVNLTVRAGTTVRWVSRSQIAHTTTSFDGLWDSPDLARDQNFTFTFAKTGEYP